MTVAEHHAALTRDRHADLLDPRWVCWLWTNLRRTLPDALACVLLPDQLHLVGPPGMGPALRRQLTAFAVRSGLRFEVPSPATAATTPKAARMVRNTFHLPVRAGLVDDPWVWIWSTLRDLEGLARPPWTRAEVVARALDLTPNRLCERLTHSVAVQASVPMRRRIDLASIDGIVSAVAAVFRQPRTEVVRTLAGRRLIVQTAATLGPIDVEDLARRLEIQGRTVCRLRDRPADASVEAVLIMLADPRLFRPVPKATKKRPPASRTGAF